MSNRRRLIVMRHAKAEPFAPTDHRRQLVDRGRADAADAGRFLADNDLVPDYAVVSTATRAVQTWEAVAEACLSHAEVSFDDAVYNGSPDVVLEALRMVPPGKETVMFVGHNPTAAYLAHQVEDGQGDPAVLERLLQGFPTSAVAVFEVDVEWSDLSPETGLLVDFHVGRS